MSLGKSGIYIYFKSLLNYTDSKHGMRHRMNSGVEIERFTLSWCLSVIGKSN